MQTGKRSVLVISPEPWSALRVSKHHYAIALVQAGYTVYFLNPPGLGVNKMRMKPGTFPGLYIVDYPNRFRGQRFLPGILRQWIDKRIITEVEQLAGIRLSIIWNFENSRFYDFRFAAPGVLKIYHQVDLNQDFNLRLAAKTADICFCTTDVIKSRLQPFNKKVFKVHHGVDSRLLATKNSLSPGGRVKASCIGNLDIPYIDVALLEELVARFPAVLFQFIGSYNPGGETYNRLKSYANVSFTGIMKPPELHRQVAASDILLVCYKVAEHREQLASPHKIMEYLATGKGVVATYTDEYKDKDGLLVMANTKEQYLEAFREVLDNLAHFNAPAEQDRRKAFAAAHTYDKQLNKIFDLINQHVDGKAFG